MTDPPKKTGEKKLDGNETRVWKAERASDRLWDIVTKVAAMVAFPVAAAIIMHEVRISKIEDTRFSTGDAAQLESRLIERINGGPVWLRESVNEMRASLKEIEARLRAIEVGR